VIPLDHFDLVVSDLDASLQFYRDLLRPLGWTREAEIEGEHGEKVIYLSVPGPEPGRRFPAVSLRQAENPRPHDRYEIGIHHVAFGAGSRDVVDERAAWLKQRGVEIESGPEEYPYSEGYYAVFFYDLDGLKLEIMHRP
jgi:glyoxylase I family protein